MMLGRVALVLALAALAVGLWASAEFLAIAAGVALFMFGMLNLEEGFRYFTGGPLEAILRVSTDRLWKSVGFGVLTTSLMQSSSLVSLITVSFVSAEMISLAAGIGVIMGANIGTTTGAWLIAGLGMKINIAAYAMPVLVFGTLFRLRRDRRLQAFGSMLLGFAFLFLGIHYMKTGFESLQSTIDLSAYALGGMRGVLIYAGIGTLVTVIMQSSHATLLITITALGAGQITYENALALAIGANFGSTVTIVLGSVSSGLGGRRLAVFHVLFNGITGVLAILLLGPIATVVDTLATALGIGASDYLLRLAIFHTLFNVLGVALFWPLVRPLEAILTRWVTAKSKGREYPQYLFRDALATPATALEAVRREVAHLADNARALVAVALSLSRSTIDGDSALLPAVQQTRRVFPLDVDDVYEEKIKGLHSEIVSFVAEAQLREPGGDSVAPLYELRTASRDIVDVVKGIKHLHKNLRRHALSINPAVRECYDQIRWQLAELLRDCQRVMDEESPDLALLSLDAVRVEQQAHTQRLTAMLDQAIRERRMPASLATSVMNDADYAQTISERFIDAVRILREVHGPLKPDELQLPDRVIAELVQTAAVVPEAGDNR